MERSADTSFVKSVLDRMKRESQGKAPAGPALLMVPLLVLYWGYLTDFSHTSIVSGINLVVHEGGHLFFAWFGSDLLAVGGGTLFQLAVPALVGVMFFRQGDHFAVAVVGFWVGINLAEIAPYAADARSQLLPLVSPFPGAPGHDWNYLLSRWGLLAQDKLVGKAFHQAGVLTMTSSLVLGAWLLRHMWESRASDSEPGQSTSQVAGSSVSSLKTRR